MDRKNPLWIVAVWLAAAVALKANALEITFLDVGEGEAIFLKSAGQTALIDSGNPLSGAVVTDFLKARGVNSLDKVIITHPHLDHMGGVFQILPRFTVKQRYDNGQNADPKNHLYRWYRQAYRNVNYQALKPGDRLTLGEAEILVLNSTQPDRSSWNKNSLVLMVSHRESRALLMADADASVEQKLLDQGALLSANLLKLGHHGHSDATTETFLQGVSPDFAVISINEDNARGYPSKKILNRLEEHSIKTLTTYEHGHLFFKSNGQCFYRSGLL